MPFRDDDYGELDPREFPDPDVDGEDSAVERCPYCRQMVYEDAEQCPVCGNYLTEEEIVTNHRPWWVILGAVVLLIVIIMFWI